MKELHHTERMTTVICNTRKKARCTLTHRPMKSLATKSLIALCALLALPLAGNAATFPISAREAEFQPKEAFRYIGAKATGGENVRIFIKTENTDWAEVRESENDMPESMGEAELFGPLLVPESHDLAYRIEYSGPETPKVTLYTDTWTEKPSAKIAAFTEGVFSVTPRSEWIAKEDIVDAATAWPAEYYPVERFIIHHSAADFTKYDDTGITTEEGWKDQARAVYRYHAKNLGWGDTGYNYIIDPYGNIFEGRAGGEGAAGGHAVRGGSCVSFASSVKGQTVGFNRGTVGIVFLGNYNKNILTGPAQKAAANLIARLSKDFNLDPKKITEFDKRNLPLIIGHKDVDCTTCPGTSTKASLDNILRLTEEAYAALPDAIATLRGTVLNAPEKRIIVKPGESANLTIAVQNNSTTTWHSFTSDKAMLTDATQSAAGPVPVAASMQETNVRPGETAHFAVSLSPTADIPLISKQLIVKLGANSVPGTEVSFSVTDRALPLAATIRSAEFPQKAFIGTAATATILFENTGTEIWSQDSLRLSTLTPELIAKSAKLAPLEKTIAPGAVATFEIPITAPKIGLHLLSLNLIVKNPQGTKNVQNGAYAAEILGVAASQASLVEEKFPTTMKPLERKTITIKVKNTGVTTWKQGKTGLRLIVNAVNDPFYDAKDWVAQLVPAWMIEKTVKPGETATLKFNLAAPKKAGTYQFSYKLKNESSIVPLDGTEDLKKKIDVRAK